MKCIDCNENPFNNIAVEKRNTKHGFERWMYSNGIARPAQVVRWPTLVPTMQKAIVAKKKWSNAQN